MNKKKWLVVVLVVSALVVSIALYKIISNDVKTSVVKEIHTGGSGCSQLERENGDNVDTFCFWAPPEKQPEYDRSIKVGDTVEYGTESDRQFIRLKKQ